MVFVTMRGSPDSGFMREASDETLMTITETVSDALNTPMEQLPPLSRSIDREGLNTIALV